MPLEEPRGHNTRNTGVYGKGKDAKGKNQNTQMQRRCVESNGPCKFEGRTQEQQRRHTERETDITLETPERCNQGNGTDAGAAPSKTIQGLGASKCTADPKQSLDAAH